MSTNCILCVTNRRTGFDLLCDTCRAKQVRNCSCGQPKAKHWHLACPACWALIPKPLQDEVYHLFKAQQGSDDHVACVRRCYEAIREGRDKGKEKREKGEPLAIWCNACGFCRRLTQEGEAVVEKWVQLDCPDCAAESVFSILATGPDFPEDFILDEPLLWWNGDPDEEGSVEMPPSSAPPRDPLAAVLAEQIQEKAITCQIMQEITRALTLLGADIKLLGAIGSWGDTLSDAEVLSGLKDWCDRHDTAGMHRGNVHSAYFDGDQTVHLYDEQEQEVEWPASWPPMVKRATLRAMGIEVKP